MNKVMSPLVALLMVLGALGFVELGSPARAQADYSPGTPMDSAWRQYGGLNGPGRSVGGYVCGLRGGWCYQGFENGFLYQAPNGHTSWIKSPVYEQWAQRDLEHGWLGFPLGMFREQDRGWHYQDFEGGELLQKPDGTWVESKGAIRSAWAAEGYQTGPVGYPVDNEVPLPEGGAYQLYENGRITWDPDIGAYTLYGPILMSWLNWGADASWLGLPISANQEQYRGWRFQDFEQGALLLSPNGQVYESYGPIREAWAASGWAPGPLGYPVSGIAWLDEEAEASYQLYENGRIMSYEQDDVGTHAMYGPILAEWSARNYEHGILGYPTSEVNWQYRGWRYQDFMGGALLLSPNGQVYESIGDSRMAWERSGWGNGPLGYPTSNVIELSDAASYQLYETGRIMTNPAGDTFFMYGKLLDAWIAQDYERGSLGYPTSDVTCDASGCTQDFEGGTLVADPAGNVTKRP